MHALTKEYRKTCGYVRDMPFLPLPLTPHLPTPHLHSSLLTSSLTPPTDWLIDRRHCELKWIAQVRQVRESVSLCLQQLPVENEQIARIRERERECAHEGVKYEEGGRKGGMKLNV